MAAAAPAVAEADAMEAQAEAGEPAAPKPEDDAAPVQAGGAASATVPTAVSSDDRSKQWDPQQFPARSPTPQCIRRVQQDIAQICRDPPPGCFVFPDEHESTVVHCLLAGNAETPYEGGMFYFYIGCPDDYPMCSPRVKIMTGLGKCRFNPNLYQTGKVCLSILNTWSGPSWQPVLSIASVLMSIQSLMNERPYHNEPGFEVERYHGDVEKYNHVIKHQTIKHAVLGMMKDLEEDKLPSCFAPVMESVFITMFEGYEETCEDNAHMDGQQFRDPFGTNQGTFHYASMLQELRGLRDRVEARMDAEGEKDD